VKRERTGSSLVVGVTKLAWMYGMSRDWAERILNEWEQAQLAGVAPVRVFRAGKRRCLYTTMAVLHAHMPPGRDVTLYRRMEAVESDVADAHRRIDREAIERRQADGDLARRIDAGHRRAG